MKIQVVIKTVIKMNCNYAQLSNFNIVLPCLHVSTKITAKVILIWPLWSKLPPTNSLCKLID